VTLGYAYGTHWAPHDIQVRELGTGRSRLEAAIASAFTSRSRPRVESLEDGIHAARMLFPRCWFDRERCEVGLEALQHYHWKPVVSQHPTGKPLPVHDWASHGADAFRGLAYRHYTPKYNPERQAAAALRKSQHDVDPYDRQFARAKASGRGGYR
jgi:phage terminase large subunit